MLAFLKKPETRPHINPRIRAYGKARIDIASRARSSADWERMWKKPVNPFPFAWDDLWKHCVEYRVDDFAAEVGFFIDVLGFPVNAFDPDYAMFTSPQGDFYFSVTPVREGEYSTPPESFRLQFLIRDIMQTAEELGRRGIVFESPPLPCTPGSNLYIGTFRSPHGIAIDLWGFVEENTAFIMGSRPGNEIAGKSGDSDPEGDGQTESLRLLTGYEPGDDQEKFAGGAMDLERSDFDDEETSIEVEYIYKEDQ